MRELGTQDDAKATLDLDVALTPAFVDADAARRRGTVYIVVDVVRATTTLAVLFDRGCSRVWVAPGIAAARAAAEHAPGHYLLGGESGGLAPPGFDFGNSPREYAAAELAAREVVFVTTNGTRALRACTGGAAIFAGAFRNADAVVHAALEAARRTPAPPAAAVIVPEPSAHTGEASEAALAVSGGAAAIVVVCAGRMGQPAYDDTLCAGYLAERLAEEAQRQGLGVRLGEGARIACDLARYVPRAPDQLLEALAASDAGRAVTAVGLAGDLEWCATLDATRAVPRVTGYDAARDLLELRASDESQ